MDLLDELLAAPIIKTVPKEEMIDTQSQTQDSQASNDDGWLDGNSGNGVGSFLKNKKGPPELWDTTIQKRVHPDNLVWARNNYYSMKGMKRNHGHPWFPARVCEDHEAMYIKLEKWQWPIPQDLRLIEFIDIPKQDPATPEKFLVSVNEIIPYYENVQVHIHNAHSNSQANSPNSKNGTSSSSNSKKSSPSVGSVMHKAAQQVLSFSVKSKEKNPRRRWNIDSIQCMGALLANCNRYSTEDARFIEDSILKKSAKYLHESLAYSDNIIVKQAEAKKEAATAEEQAEDGEECSSSSDEDITEYGRRDLTDEKKVRLEYDQWICYTHKIFKKTMYTRIVEVTRDKNQRLIVENGEILEAKDQIRILDTQLDGKYNVNKGSSYKALKEYKYKSGRSKVLESLHARAAARAHNDMIDIGGQNNGRNSDNYSDGDAQKKKRVLPTNQNKNDSSNSGSLNKKAKTKISPKKTIPPKKTVSPKKAPTAVASDSSSDDGDDPFA